MKYIVNIKKSNGKSAVSSFDNTNGVIALISAQFDGKTRKLHSCDINAIKRGDFGHYAISDENTSCYIRVTI